MLSKMYSFLEERRVKAKNFRFLFPGLAYSKHLLKICILDKPYIAAFNERVECEARCNFTIDSNPFAIFVSLENAGIVYALCLFQTLFSIKS